MIAAALGTTGCLNWGGERRPEDESAPGVPTLDPTPPGGGASTAAPSAQNPTGGKTPAGEPAAPKPGGAQTPTLADPTAGGLYTEYGSGDYAVLLTNTEGLDAYCWYIEETVRVSAGSKRTAYDHICVDAETNCLAYEPEGWEEETSTTWVRVDYDTVSGGALFGSCEIHAAYWDDDPAVECLFHDHCNGDGLCVDWRCVCPVGGDCPEPTPPVPTTMEPDAGPGGTAGGQPGADGSTPTSGESSVPGSGEPELPEEPPTTAAPPEKPVTPDSPAPPATSDPTPEEPPAMSESEQPVDGGAPTTRAEPEPPGPGPAPEEPPAMS